MTGGIIDIHAHVWLGREREDAALLRQAAEDYRIERILISPLGTHRPSGDEIRELNRAAAAVCREDGLFRAYVTVAPEHPDAPDVLEEGIQNGAVGMKLWVSCLCDDPCCDRLYEKCAETGLPVLVHTFAKTVGQLPGESTAVHLRSAALRHPETRFILAHLGGNCCHGVPLIQDLGNVWTDFSGSNCRFDDLPYALERLGVGRILFGTDMPGSFAMSWGQVLSAGLTAEEKEKICRENALELFRL